MNKFSCPSVVAAVWLSTLASSSLYAGNTPLEPEMPTAPVDQSIQSTPEPVKLEVCGEAKLSVLFWDVYESTLLTPGGQWQPGIRPLRLEIRYLRDIAAKDLIEQTRKEWQAQGIDSAQHDAWLERLREQWRDVTEGDRIALAIDEQGASTFYFNDQAIGVIADPQFGQDFSGIWLSPKTTRPELRSALIGSNKKDG